MGVIDISPAMERFAGKIKTVIPPCQDPEKQICHHVRLRVVGKNTTANQKRK
jgi:hypothetical protein